MSRAERLQAYIDATSGRPIIGTDDCGPWVMRWVSAETNENIKLPSYKTRDAGYAIARKAGGLVKLADQLFSPFAIERCWSEPELGDVAVVKLSDRETAAIFCAGGIVALRGERSGVMFLKPKQEHILRTWSINGR